MVDRDGCKYATFYRLNTPFLVASPFQNNSYYHNFPHIILQRFYSEARFPYNTYLKQEKLTYWSLSEGVFVLGSGCSNVTIITFDLFCFQNAGWKLHELKVSSSTRRKGLNNHTNNHPFNFIASRSI